MKRINLTTWVLLLVLFFSQVKQSWAGPIVFSDDFSHGLDKWEQTRGDNSIWSVVDGKAQAIITTYQTVSELIPKDEFWNQQWKNLEYSLEFTPLAGVDRNVSFGFQNLTNWYDIHFVDTFGELARVVNGHLAFSEFFSFVMQNGHTYQVRVRFKDGEIKIFVDDTQILDTYDWSAANHFGKIALRAGTGAVFPTQILFDNVVVRLLDETDLRLHVPSFKQHDPQWKLAIYDSAQSWSGQPTIERWGCALTSAVMILRYHGITQLPNGQDLQPLYLNQWLNNQVDGYLGQGNLNWLAISRLTRLMSSQLQTPKLEYRRHEGADLTTAKQEIENEKPVIIQIPGHFLVADGITAEGTDLLIQDPAYTYTRLSQHQTSPISTRTFEPSQTDLSYILITHQPGLKIELLSETGQPIPNVEYFTENVLGHPQPNSVEAQALSYVQLAKPAPGNYRLRVSQPQLAEYSLQVLAYDQEGNPTQLESTGIVGPQPTELKLTFHKTKPSQLTRVSTLKNFRKHLWRAYHAKGFRWLIWCWMLDHTIGLAERKPQALKQYKQTIKTQLQKGKSYLNPPSYRYLEQELEAL